MDVRAKTPWAPRDLVALVADQLGAIDRWNAHRRDTEAADTARRSREARLDQSRRMDVLRREHAALVHRTRESLVLSAHVLHRDAERRAVIVHRNEWFRTRVAEALAAKGVRIVTQLDNGADAVGCVVAEQPDLLLVEDQLPMLSGAQVLGAARTYAPTTLCAAQVDHDGRAAALRAAGAHVVWSRRVPPGEVAVGLGQLVGV